METDWRPYYIPKKWYEFGVGAVAVILLAITAADNVGRNASLIMVSWLVLELYIRRAEVMSFLRLKGDIATTRAQQAWLSAIRELTPEQLSQKEVLAWSKLFGNEMSYWRSRWQLMRVHERWVGHESVIPV